MSSNTLCTTCVRLVRQRAHREFGPTNPSHRFTRSAQRSIRPFTTSPRAFDNKSPPPPPPPRTPSASTLQELASQLRSSNTLRTTTEPYIAYGSTEDLFKACASQCDYIIPSVQQEPPEPAPKNAAQEDVGEGSGWWYSPREQGGLGLEVTFNTWAQVVFLHMYLLTVRLRMFPQEHAGVWHQNLLDHFFYAAEDRMAVWHGMSARGVRNKYLKDLWMQWRGLLLSYDEGLIKGDAVLGTAVWRNMFKGSEEVDIADVALVTAYMRKQLLGLAEMPDEKVASGEVVFGNPAEIKRIAAKDSLRMRKSFSLEEMKESERR